MVVKLKTATKSIVINYAELFQIILNSTIKSMKSIQDELMQHIIVELLPWLKINLEELPVTAQITFIDIFHSISEANPDCLLLIDWKYLIGLFFDNLK